MNDLLFSVAIIMENFSLFYSNEEDALLSYADIRWQNVELLFQSFFTWARMNRPKAGAQKGGGGGRSPSPLHFTHRLEARLIGVIWKGAPAPSLSSM